MAILQQANMMLKNHILNEHIICLLTNYCKLEQFWSISLSQKAENEYTRDNHFSVIQASYAASNKPTTIYIHGGPKKFNFFPIHYIFGTAQNNMKLVVVKALTDF